MQGHRALVLALLASAQASSPSEKASADQDFSCYADIKGFPAVTTSTSVNAETVLAKIRPQGTASFAGKMPTGTMKFDECSEDSFAELSLGSMKQLFRLVSLTPKDNFVDLSSGLGEVPVTAAVLSGAQHATGVELSKERHETACQSLASLEKELKGDSNGNASMVELVQGDMLTVDLSDDTVVFTNSYCFRRHLMDKLAEKLATELPEGARIASTKAFVDLPPRLAKVSAEPLPLGNGITVSIYQVEGPRPPKGQKHEVVRMSRRQIKERAAHLKATKQAMKLKGALSAVKKLSLLSKALQGK